MFINPRIAIEEGWVTHPDCKTIEDWEKRKFISPNAIDFPLDFVFKIHGNNSFHISEGGKQMRGVDKLEPVTDRNGNSFWNFDGNSAYDGMSDMYVKVPEGVVVPPLVVRSTFNRNGIYITSGYYDTNFQGNLGFIIHNRLGPAYITPGTRIGQVAFVEAKHAKLYEGKYNTDQGQHWTENHST